MSQHIFEQTVEGSRYQILMGWDRRMNRYFGVILPWEETEEKEGFCDWHPVWSNLYEGDGTLSLEEIVAEILSKGIKLPAGILDDLCRDQRTNAGNQLFRHQTEGRVSVFFEGRGYAERFCTFESEELYLSCFPILEKVARKMGFLRVTESLEEE